MSTDQLRRAAEQAEHLAGLEHPEWLSAISQRDAAVAALLRAAADWPRPDSLHYETPQCRKRLVRNGIPAPHGPLPDLPCRGCALDDVAAAYLGEEPQP